MTPNERFWSHVDRGEPDECWAWTAARTGGGYGSVKWRGRHSAAHRVAYELLVGPIPSGADLDHLCRNRACVNPSHLEPVTRRVNLSRSPLTNMSKTHCPEGHAYDESNTIIEVRRRCRRCTRKHERARRALKRSAA